MNTTANGTSQRTGANASEDLLRFWDLALRLKALRRTGWIDRGVHQPESSADHSWSVGLLGWMLAREVPGLDRDRVLLLGLIHDLPEALAGDVTPFDAVRDAAGHIDDDAFQLLPEYSPAARKAKEQAEREALEEMLAFLPEDLATEMWHAWREYGAGETPEAQFVQQVDKLETLLQAEHYAGSQPGLQMQSFRLGAQRDVVNPILRSVLEAREANWRRHPQDEDRR